MQALFRVLLEGRKQEAVTLLQQKMDSEVPADVLLNQGLIAAMKRAGTLYDAGEISASKLLRTVEAVDACMALLRPYLFG